MPKGVHTRLLAHTDIRIHRETAQDWELTVSPAVFVNIVVALTYAALFKSDRSFSGFNQTFSGKSQFRIAPLHLFG